MKPEPLTHQKVMLYPLWVRIWHWCNAVIFILLLASGISLHFADPAAPLIPFAVARVIHNLSGLCLTLGFVLYVVNNGRSGNFRHYWPVFQGLVGRIMKQTDYYARGIFLGLPHPIAPTWEQKFNPLQQLTYLAIMYLLVPLVIVTGFMLWVPEWAPGQVLGMDGLWPAAVLHYLLAVALGIFFITHLYLITVGETMTSQIKKMITGWEEISIHKENDHERQ
ncbi:MAG: cytochrome b/b6 domain-containing protein [Magnetococcales bacterium]|nr:cytochrome b/b6 domain-containing protein [Magnetococcales bacterium]MBF0419031.1 cytochrome b/b6 domain-containing protein [Magnetococcales bacterium]